MDRLGHNYELPPMRTMAGAPYELPPMIGDELGFPSGHDLAAGDFAMVGSIAVAGAELARAMGDDYAAIGRCLGAHTRTMVASPPFGAAYSGDFLGLGRAFRGVAHAVAPVVRLAEKGVASTSQQLLQPAVATATHAAAALVHGVRQLHPEAIAQMAAIRARALAGSVEHSVVFHTLRAVANRALAPAVQIVHSISPLLPYAQAVASLVPGVGQGVGAALGAAQVLADGRPITDAAIAAVRGAVPGGPIGKLAFDTAWGLVEGRPVATAALGALRNQVPGDLPKKAFDTAVALATARTAQQRRQALQTAALQALGSQLPRPAGGSPYGLPGLV